MPAGSNGRSAFNGTMATMTSSCAGCDDVMTTLKVNVSQGLNDNNISPLSVGQFVYMTDSAQLRLSLKHSHLNI